MRHDHATTVRSLAAGAAGGILGTVAMAAAQLLWNRFALIPDELRRRRDRRAGLGVGRHAHPAPRSHGQGRSAGEQLVDRASRFLVGHRPSMTTREWGSALIHYGIGAAAGVAYAPLADRYPAVVRAGRGTAYGLAVWLVGEELLVPYLLRAGKRPAESPPEEHAYAAFAHLAYGLTLDSTRQLLVRF